MHSTTTTRSTPTPTTSTSTSMFTFDKSRAHALALQEQAASLASQRAQGLSTLAPVRVRWEYPTDRHGKPLVRPGWVAVPSLTVRFTKDPVGALVFTIHVGSKIRRQHSLLHALTGEQPAYLVFDFSGIDKLDLSLREHLFSYVRDFLAHPLEIETPQGTRTYRVAGSGDGLIKDQRVILLPEEHAGFFTTSFQQAHAALIYSNILAGEALSVFRVPGHEYAVVSTWGDLRRLGMDVPDWHADDAPLPDSQVWVRDRRDAGLQVRFATAFVAGKGKTFCQPQLNFSAVMRQRGLRFLIPDSCLKSHDKAPAGDLHVAVKMRNSLGTMMGSYYLGTMLSCLPLTDEDRQWLEMPEARNWGQAQDLLIRASNRIVNRIQVIGIPEVMQALLDAGRFTVQRVMDMHNRVYLGAKVGERIVGKLRIRGDAHLIEGRRIRIQQAKYVERTVLKLTDFEVCQ